MLKLAVQVYMVFLRFKFLIHVPEVVSEAEVDALDLFREEGPIREDDQGLDLL